MILEVVIFEDIYREIEELVDIEFVYFFFIV